MNNNKATESQKKLLMVLLMAVVFFSAYRFVYQPLVDETDALVAQNRALEDEIGDLKVKAANIEYYQTETEALTEKIGAVLKKFGPGVTPEKSIRFFVELARVAKVEIPTISFGDASLLYTTSSLTNGEGTPYNQYSATYNVAYSTTYQGLKTLIAYVGQYPERMHLNTLTAAYNSETDSLSGNFSIDWYMLTGTDKEYRFEDQEGIDIGNGNIFRSGSGEMGGEFTFDFDFENGGEDETRTDDEAGMGAGTDEDGNGGEDGTEADEEAGMGAGTDEDGDGEEDGTEADEEAGMGAGTDEDGDGEDDGTGAENEAGMGAGTDEDGDGEEDGTEAEDEAGMGAGTDEDGDGEID